MLILLFLYLLLPLVQIVFFIHGQLFLSLPDVLNFSASIAALHWILANVILSSKLPWLQGSIPYDARIRFHILSSAGICAAVLYHGVFKLVSGFAIDAVSWILMSVLIGLFSLALLWIPVPGFKSVRIWLTTKVVTSERLDYDRSKTLHRLFVLVLGLLLLIHISAAELFESVSPLSALLYWLLYLGAFGIYLLSITRVFSVDAEVFGIEKRQGILTIHLTPKRPLKYRGGQFAFMTVRTPSGKKEEHPFSFLSAPAADSPVIEQRAPVSFAIRALGDFTRDLENLKPGDRVHLKGSFGNFRPRNEEALCFVASGIGTVPVISILKELHALQDTRPVHLFLAVNHRDEIPERQTVEKIAATMENLTLHTMVFPEDGLKYSEDFFRENLPDHQRYSYYLCSSPGVRAAVVSALSDLGVKKSAIHFEAFSFG